MSFIQGNTIHRGVQCLTSSGALFGRDLGQERVLQSIRRGNMETGHDWLGGQDFFTRLAGPIFQGKVNQLKLSWRTMIGVCQVSCKCRLMQVQICDVSWVTGVASILQVSVYTLTFSQVRLSGLGLEGYVGIHQKCIERTGFGLRRYSIEKNIKPWKGKRCFKNNSSW